MQHVDAAMSLPVLAYMEQKELVRRWPQKQGIDITLGQPSADVWRPSGKRPFLSAAFIFARLRLAHPRFSSG